MRLGNQFYIPHKLDWAKEQQDRDVHADAEPRAYRGHEFTKTLALACPWCSAVFFVWQAVGHETAPYDDPSPIREPGMGQRYTCGNPICWDKEQVFQMKQSENYKQTCSSYWNSKECKPTTSLKPKAKLTGFVG